MGTRKRQVWWLLSIWMVVALVLSIAGCAAPVAAPAGRRARRRW